MRQVSAESATVPDLRIRDRTGGFREEQRVLADERIAQQVVVGGHRADHQAVAVLAHPAKLVDPAEVDEDGRGGQPQSQHRHQGLPACDDLRVLSGLRKRRHRVVNRGRRDIVETRRNHRGPS